MITLHYFVAPVRAIGKTTRMLDFTVNSKHNFWFDYFGHRSFKHQAPRHFKYVRAQDFSQAICGHTGTTLNAFFHQIQSLDDRIVDAMRITTSRTHAFDDLNIFIDADYIPIYSDTSFNVYRTEDIIKFDQVIWHTLPCQQ